VTITIEAPPPVAETPKPAPPAPPKPAIKRINSGSGHRYTVDGKKADGVTTLIKNGRPNPALIGWAAREVAEYVADNLETVNTLAAAGREPLIAALKAIPNAVRNKAALRGTALHTFAEKLVDNETVEYPDEIAGHVESYVAFLDEWQVQPVLVETVVASRKWGIAGTTDLVADVVTFGDITPHLAPWLTETIPAGTRMRIIFDPKTSRSGVWPDAAYQLAAYRYCEVYVDADGAEQPMDALGIELGAVVHVRADGYDVHPMDAGPETFKTFTHLATVARRCADDRAKLVGSPIIPKEYT
jgi:hypothetical protein